MRGLNKTATPHLKSLHPESRLLQQRLESVNQAYDKLVPLLILFLFKYGILNVFFTYVF